MDLNKIAQTIATTVATAVAAASTSTSYVTTHSNTLDPYDNASFDVSTKKGKYAWSVITKMQDGWKLLTCSTDLVNKMMDPFKDHQTQFGLDNILRVPTKKGMPKSRPILAHLAV